MIKTVSSFRTVHFINRFCVFGALIIADISVKVDTDKEKAKL